MACNIRKDKTDIGEDESADDRKCMRAYEICIIDPGSGLTIEQAAKICDEIGQMIKSPLKDAEIGYLAMHICRVTSCWFDVESRQSDRAAKS